MILYQYKCANGHSFERMARLSDFDKAVPCPICSKSAAREVTAPGLAVRTMADDARIYGEHNITHRGTNADGSVTSLPNSPADQCGCGNCASHRRRASVTAVAEPGKELYI